MGVEVEMPMNKHSLYRPLKSGAICLFLLAACLTQGFAFAGPWQDFEKIVERRHANFECNKLKSWPVENVKIGFPAFRNILYITKKVRGKFYYYAVDVSKIRQVFAIPSLCDRGVQGQIVIKCRHSCIAQTETDGARAFAGIGNTFNYRYGELTIGMVDVGVASSAKRLLDQMILD